MLIFIVIIFLICWGPRLIFNIMIKYGLSSFTNSAYTARVACYLLSFIHSAVNPFVYGLMSSNFRRMIITKCRGLDSEGRSEAITMSHYNNQFAINHSHRRASDSYVEPAVVSANYCKAETELSEEV